MGFSPQKGSLQRAVCRIRIQLHIYCWGAAQAQFVRDYLSKNVGGAPGITVELEGGVEGPRSRTTRASARGRRVALVKVHGSGEQELTASPPLPGAVSVTILEK